MGAFASRSSKRATNKISAVTAEGSGGAASKHSVISTLTEVQLEEFREAFDAFDKDGGGSIDKEELMDLFRSLGQEPTQEELDNMVAAADTDGNGTIDFFEFATLMAHMMAKEDSYEAKFQKLKGAFAVFDRNSDGSWRSPLPKSSHTCKRSLFS